MNKKLVFLLLLIASGAVSCKGETSTKNAEPKVDRYTMEGVMAVHDEVMP